MFELWKCYMYKVVMSNINIMVMLNMWQKVWLVWRVVYVNPDIGLKQTS